MTDVLSVAHRSQVVKARRAYTLLGLGLLLPGSAQAVHGRRWLGRLALSVWMILVLVALVVVILGLILGDRLLGLLVGGVVMRAVALLIVALGAFWVGLTLNTWWIARPGQLGRTKGAVFTVVALVLAGALTAGTVWAGRAVWAADSFLGSVLVGGGNTEVQQGRLNILLLGSDAGPGRDGARPDSVNLVSLSADTGRAVIVGLPRNLEYVPFADGSPLRGLYPTGYGCASEECLLNAVYQLGWEHAELYGGVADPGAQAMIDAVSGTTGLTINYYVMINMQGFVDLIDALGGVTVNIKDRQLLVEGEDVWLEAGPNQHLDGYQAMWFARARALNSDYDRMQRQRCVMAAVLDQVNPTTVVQQFAQLLDAASGALTTSIPRGQFAKLGLLANQTRALPIMSVALTPPLVEPADPDFALIQLTVADAIAASEALDAAAANPPTEAASDDPAPTGPPTASPTDPATDGPAPAVAEDLGLVC